MGAKRISGVPEAESGGPVDWTVRVSRLASLKVSRSLTT